VTRHFIEKIAPEVEGSHLREVVLCGIRVIGVTGGAGIKWEVEFNAALLYVSGVIGIPQARKRV
jgi:hypothetical protein